MTSRVTRANRSTVTFDCTSLTNESASFMADLHALLDRRLDGRDIDVASLQLAQPAHTRNAREHLPLAEEILGPGLVEDHLAVGPGDHGKRHAAGDVGLAGAPHSASVAVSSA